MIISSTLPLSKRLKALHTVLSSSTTSKTDLLSSAKTGSFLSTPSNQQNDLFKVFRQYVNQVVCLAVCGAFNLQAVRAVLAVLVQAQAQAQARAQAQVVQEVQEAAEVHHLLFQALRGELRL